jgi:hypothetical protein
LGYKATILNLTNKLNALTLLTAINFSRDHFLF